MLYFADDNFVSKFSRTKELCDAMAPLNKKWFQSRFHLRRAALF